MAQAHSTTRGSSGRPVRIASDPAQVGCPIRPQENPFGHDHHLADLLDRPHDLRVPGTLEPQLAVRDDEHAVSDLGAAPDCGTRFGERDEKGGRVQDEEDAARIDVTAPTARGPGRRSGPSGA
jgi:hypothetical protein